MMLVYHCIQIKYQLVFGLARMGVLVNFVSHTVVIGFTAGAGETTSTKSYLLYAFLFFAGLYVLYFSNAGFKKQIDKLLGRAKEW